MPTKEDKTTTKIANNDPPCTKLSFDEFLLFYGSAEKVTDRRLETNRWNYSVCTAVIVACAAILGWATTNRNFLTIALISVFVLSIMAILFCRLWIAQIRDFKMLNNAKFEVLNQMAPYICFSSDEKDERKSFLPFEKEWKALTRTKSTIELSNTNILVLSSSNMEYLIPHAFTWLFALLIIATIVIAIANWGVIINPSSLTLPVIITPIVSPTAIP